VHRRLEALPDQRKRGPHTRYRVQDAAVGAVGIFCTPSPALLDDPRHLQNTKGHPNACTVCGVETMPCHHQRRTRLDPLRPRARDGVELAVFAGLAQSGLLAHWRGLAEPLLLALDGTQDFSSQTMHGQHCRRRQPSQGATRSSQSAMTPGSVCPGRAAGLALPPACLRPQDGHDQHACARVAGNRWLDTDAAYGAPDGGTVLGAARSRNPPLGQLARENGCNCLCVCQPAAPPPRYERVAFWQAHDGRVQRESRPWHGRDTAVPLSRSIHAGLLRRGHEALSVLWVARTVVKANTGEPLSHHSFLTPHRVRAATSSPVAQAGRGRWQGANAQNHGRTTKGSHREHHCGHGTRDRAAFMLSLNV
jgi:hypothetical protein